jgi:hypothetical protein
MEALKAIEPMRRPTIYNFSGLQTHNKHTCLCNETKTKRQSESFTDFMSYKHTDLLLLCLKYTFCDLMSLELKILVLKQF